MTICSGVREVASLLKSSFTLNSFLFRLFLCSLHLLSSATGLNLCTTLTLYVTNSCVRCFDIICWPTMVWKFPGLALVRTCWIRVVQLLTLILWNSAGIQTFLTLHWNTLRLRCPWIMKIKYHSYKRVWSQSGKLVLKMFTKIQDYIEDAQALVCVLIEEVESLTHARPLSLAGIEPSDSLRVVNALLTQIDQIQRYSNSHG